MVTLNFCQQLNEVASSIPQSVACYFFVTAEAIACLKDILLNLISFKVNHFLTLLCFPLITNFSAFMAVRMASSFSISLEEHRSRSQAVFMSATEAFALSCQLFDVWLALLISFPLPGRRKENVVGEELAAVVVQE